MANRFVPFGYEISNGEIRVVNKEAEVVRNIFTLYVQGQSLRTISERLNMISVTYAGDGRKWDKNIVKRILDNRRYAGMNEYPAIIPNETARIAHEIKEKKYIGINQDVKPRNDAYHEKCRCAACGGKLTKFHKVGGSCRKIYWRCADRNCEGYKHWVNEAVLEEILADILNEISEDSKITSIQTDNYIEKDEEYIKEKREIERMFDEQIADSKMFVKKALEFTEMLFRKCRNSDNPAFSQRIEERMALYSKIDIPDGNVIKDIVRRIEISPQKIISVKLINGKEFIREFKRKCYKA